MAGWDGSGNFTRAYNWVDEKDAGNNIDSTKFDAENDAFAAGIEACIAKNGENTATGDLPMGGNKHTGVGDGSALTHYSSVGQVQDGSVVWGGTSGGAANVQTITLAPAATEYTTGMQIAFIPGFANTASMTLNVNGIGAKAVYRGGIRLPANALNTGSVVVVSYDGTNFELVSDSLPQFCDVYQANTDQSIADGNTDAITMTQEVADYWTMHDAGSNTERITVPAGVWIVSGSVSVDSTAATGALLEIYLDGSTTTHSASFFLSAGSDAHVNVSAVIVAGSAGYFDLRIDNNTGGTLTVLNVRFSVARVA